MKKGILFSLIAFTLLSFNLEARPIRIIGNGAGGTTVGDKTAACERAYDRATADGENQCYNRDGFVLSVSENDCNCHRQPGSRDDYSCRATVHITCDVACRNQEVTLQGEGMGYDYNRSLACDDAVRRAESETNFQCSRQDGFITDSQELSCNCRRTNAGEYECRSVVRAQCEVQSCSRR